MSPAPVFVRIPGSHHPVTRLRLVPGFRDPGSVLILGQVTQYGNPYLICIAVVKVTAWWTLATTFTSTNDDHGATTPQQVYQFGSSYRCMKRISYLESFVNYQLFDLRYESSHISITISGYTCIQWKCIDIYSLLSRLNKHYIHQFVME